MFGTRHPCLISRSEARQSYRMASRLCLENLSKFARTLQKGQLITLEGTLRYREAEDEVEGTRFKHRIAEIHAISLKRLSKVEAADDPSDGAGDE
jgi:single-strand DNA-binding protein